MKKGLLFGLLFFLTIVFAVAAGGCLHVHRWSEWTTVSEARCDKMGVLERVCAGCGAGEHDYSALASHEYGEWEPVQGKPCTEGFWEQCFCVHCGARKMRELPPRPHVYDSYVVAPTCTEPGGTVCICRYCGDSCREDETPPTGVHTPEYTRSTEDGHRKFCSVCRQDLGLEPHAMRNNICTLCSYRDPSPLLFSLIEGKKEYEVTGYRGEDLKIIIPAVFHGYPVTRIGKDAFYRSELQSIEIPDSVRSVGPSAFYGSDLRSVTLPDSITEAGSSAFAYCKGLVQVGLSAGLTALPDYLFCGSGLTDAALPGGCREIGRFAFGDCDALESVSLQDGLVSIGERAFSGNVKLSEINLPDTVVSIGRQAFERCEALTRIELPRSLRSLNEAAFIGSGLTEIVIGENLREIAPAAFGGCKNLRRIFLPEGLKTVGTSAFAGCNAVEELHLPASLTRIGNRSFGVMEKLRKITVAEGNPAYFAEDNCLIERGEMRMIIGNRQGSIPDGVKVLGRETVSACADLTDLSIPASVERIESGAVARCPALEGILFAADSRLKEIDSGSFSNCPGLKPQVFGNAVYFGAEDNPFFVLLKVYDTDTDFVQIHEDTKVIAARAFSGYENGALREILLPEGLRSIGAAAFDGAGLTNVFLPATIEHMGSDVFRDCEALKTVVCDLFTRPDSWERDWLGAAQAEVLWLTHAHVYGEWTCDKGEHWRICSVCDKTERGAHTFADGRCTACGVHESISALRFSLAAGAAYAGQRRFKVAQSLDGIRAS